MSSCSSTNSSASCMEQYWKSLKNVSEAVGDSCETSSTSLSSFFGSSTETTMKSMDATSDAVKWLVDNRLGFAFVAGLVMVPSQFMGPNAEDSMSIVRSACECRSGMTYAEHGSFTRDDITLRYVVYYPKGKQAYDNSRCVLYHNPNGITVAGYLATGSLEWTPAQIVDLEKCPIVLYDYRGTGINRDSDPNSSSCSAFKPTYKTVVDDGALMLEYVLCSFVNISVWGSSLGGGVATASLNQYIEEVPVSASRVSLTNHDSFTTTPEVVFPSGGSVARFVGKCVGGSIDAATPMLNLLTKNIAITILCHLKDPVIPAGARMAELVLGVKILSHTSRPNAIPNADEMKRFSNAIVNQDNVTLFISKHTGHADLSDDMMKALRSKAYGVR